MSTCSTENRGSADISGRHCYCGSGSSCCNNPKSIILIHLVVDLEPENMLIEVGATGANGWLVSDHAGERGIGVAVIRQKVFLATGSHAACGMMLPGKGSRTTAPLARVRVDRGS